MVRHHPDMAVAISIESCSNGLDNQIHIDESKHVFLLQQDDQGEEETWPTYAHDQLQTSLDALDEQLGLLGFQS